MSIENVGSGSGYNPYQALLQSRAAYQNRSETREKDRASRETSNSPARSNSTSTAPSSPGVSPGNLVQAQANSFISLESVSASLPDGITLSVSSLEGVVTTSSGSQELVNAGPKGYTAASGSEQSPTLDAISQELEQIADHFLGENVSTGSQASSSSSASSSTARSSTDTSQTGSSSKASSA